MRRRLWLPLLLLMLGLVATSYVLLRPFFVPNPDQVVTREEVGATASATAVDSYRDETLAPPSSGSSPSAEGASRGEESITVGEGQGSTTEAEAISGVPVTLTESQRQLLSSLGVDPDTVTITPELVTCVTEVVGEARVAAYQAGETPTARELFSLSRCLPLLQN
jgi:hypothetical protein